MEKPQSEALRNALAAFAPKLASLLKERGLSQAELGRQLKRHGLKVSTKTINNIVNAKHPPELDNLAAIADYFGVPLWVMLVPGLPPDMVSGEPLKRLDKLVRDYIVCGAQGRKAAEDIASAYSGANVK